MKYAIAVALVAMALSGAHRADAQVQPPQERINTALARAKQVGIPVALLESKIAEGKAKGVSLDRIAVAIERRQAALERASQALRGSAAGVPSTLAVSADAIESGVNETVLRAVAENAPGDRRNVAIAALTELVHQGHTPEAALGRVREALKRGPDALSNLPAEAASDNRGRGRGRGAPGGADSGSTGGGGGSAGGDAGPPAAVPGPGKPPQAGRPQGQGQGQGGGQGQGQGQGQGGDPGGSGNPGQGRGRQ